MFGSKKKPKTKNNAQRSLQRIAQKQVKRRAQRYAGIGKKKRTRKGW